MSTHVRERLSAYLDGELDSAERSTIDAHLASVPRVRRARSRSSRSSIRPWPSCPCRRRGTTTRFAARVRARIEAEDAREARQGRRPFALRALPAWTWAAAAARSWPSSRR